MGQNLLNRFNRLGQIIWLDFIDRSVLLGTDSGAKLVDGGHESQHHLVIFCETLYPEVRVPASALRPS
jgi:hypothetical protein